MIVNGCEIRCVHVLSFPGLSGRLHGCAKQRPQCCETGVLPTKALMWWPDGPFNEDPSSSRCAGRVNPNRHSVLLVSCMGASRTCHSEAHQPPDFLT